jgi:hypothetical protein
MPKFRLWPRPGSAPCIIDYPRSLSPGRNRRSTAVTGRECNKVALSSCDLVRKREELVTNYDAKRERILPGWIRSEMTAGIMANEKFVSNVMPRIPMPRFAD